MQNQFYSIQLGYKTKIGANLIALQGVYNRQDYVFKDFEPIENLTGGNDARDLYRISMNWIRFINAQWQLMISPRYQHSKTAAATSEFASSYGLISALQYRANTGAKIGLGFSYINEAYYVKTTPVLLVKWPITDQLRLDNPYETSFAGRAGLEFAYQIEERIELALGGLIVQIALLQIKVWQH